MDDLETAVKRGVEKIYPSEEDLIKLLRSGKKISLYCGYDPTAPYLHLGHAATLFKLADFQNLGCKVIFLIGDFTGMIGDPTDKSATRVKLSREQVLQNAKTYREQAGKILDFDSPTNTAEIRFNSEWSDKLTMRDSLELSSNFTVQQMIERDMFDKRFKEGKPISLHEFFYPLLQGYDSVAMDVDLEVGGNDQTFNMLAGRTLMRALKNKEKFVLTTSILEDEHGKKMSKSEGNFVSFCDSPNEMYAKVMAFPDTLIVKTLYLCTRLESKEIQLIQERLEKGENPMNLKKILARTIVTIFHDASKAKAAEAEFVRVVQNQEEPSVVKTVKVPEDSIPIKELVSKYSSVPSISQAVRLIEQGAVEYGGVKVTNPNDIIKIDNNKTLKIGKKDFLKPKYEKFS